MKAIPTMPSPTMTTFLRSDGGLGYFSVSFSSSVREFGGSLLTAMPGEEVAHDIFGVDVVLQLRLFTPQ